MLPTDLLKFNTQLLGLTMTKCQIQDIPSGFFQPLHTLTYLALDDNDLDEEDIEDDTLESLNSLETLILAKNSFRKLPRFMGLENLKILKVDSNEITDLENVRNLDNLEEFTLRSNFICQIDLDELPRSLLALDLRANNIDKISSTLTGGMAPIFSNLTTLLLADNLIESLPQYFASQFPNLRVLDLSLNPLVRLGPGQLPSSIRKL